MATDIQKFLEDNPPAAEFRPYCFHDSDSDTLTFYFRNDRDYSKRLTDHVTLFLAIDSEEIIGCRIKGVNDIIQDLPNFININHGDVPLSIVFLPFRGMADECTRNAIRIVARAATDQQLTLAPCGD